MKDKINKLLQNHTFFKNIAVLVSGNIIGYGIYILCLPILGRIFPPELMGEYDLIVSSGKFVIDFISFGLIIAILLPKEDSDAVDLCQIILASNVFFLSTGILLLLIIRNKYHLFETSIPYSLSVLLLAAYLFFYNIQMVFYSYTNRRKLYRVLFWNPIVQNFFNVILSIVLGYIGLGTTGYLLGTILSYIICCIHMGIHVKPFYGKISISRWKKQLIKYKNIPLVQMPANIISQIGNEIPTQYLGRVFGSELLGGYVMAKRILGIPITLLSVPVNRVVYQTMADKVSKGENVGDFCFGIVEKNIKYAILPIGAIVILAKPFVPLFLGEEWKIAGDYIAILGVVFLLKFCSGCISGTFVVMGKQKLSLIMSFLCIAMYVACFYLSDILNLGVFHTILLYAIIEFVYQVINLVLCVYCTHYSMKKLCIFFLKYIIGGNVIIYSVYFCVNTLIYTSIQ